MNSVVTSEPAQTSASEPEEKRFFFVRDVRCMDVPGDGCIVTIGAFDGIHRGHQAILEQVREQQERYHLPTTVIVFEPQPAEYFSQEKSPARLMRLREKVNAILARGIDRVICLRFNSILRNMEATEFVREVLARGLKVRSLVVGDDFQFGAGRGGDFGLLRSLGEQYGFAVTDTRTVLWKGERISSTRIREALQRADFELVHELLGRPFCIGGRVVYGQQLGRTVGVPTANINLHRYRAPLQGVYTVRVHRGGESWPGVANVGVRPTVGDIDKPILEVHFLDRSEEVYGQYLNIEFCSKLRDERKFDGLEPLVRAIRQDIADARAYFGLD